jgi:hypothetical protein
MRKSAKSEINGEKELRTFLSPYRKILSPVTCAQSLSPDQVSVWVFKNGRWRQTEPPDSNTRGEESWCRYYLQSSLGLTQKEYNVAKKELFAAHNALTGVYRHKSEDLYALVYQDAASIKNWAALTGGAVLAGGALLGAGAVARLRM